MLKVIYRKFYNLTLKRCLIVFAKKYFILRNQANSPGGHHIDHVQSQGIGGGSKI